MPHATPQSMSFTEFVKTHRVQLDKCAIPERYWCTLYNKLKDEVFDAGSSFGMLKVLHADSDSEEKEEEESEYSWQVVVSAEDGIEESDENNIFLIDHAWTYRVDQARKQLAEYPGLVARMSALMDINTEGKTAEEITEKVLEEMWKYNQTYSIGNASHGSNEAVPIWYIMDEFGSRIQHSEMPSVKIVPFYFGPTQITFSVMWPLRDLEEGDEVTRTFIHGVHTTTESLYRKMLLLPWQPEDMTHLSFTNADFDVDYFMKYRVNETLPNLEVEFPGLPKDRNIRVYSDNEQVTGSLTDPKFELVESPDEADIIWTSKSWKDYKSLSEDSPGKFINQFPYEVVLTVKDLLPITARRIAKKPCDTDSLELEPKWLPVTYSLKTELPQFVAYYQKREQKGLNNHWICKPYNLARGLDIHITNNLNYMIRLNDSGPKVACKYIDNPVLFHREEVGHVKMDIRYMVLLSSVQPLKMYCHKVFWLRFANKPYSLDHCDDYEKHFTVMNYRETNLKQIHHDEFIPLFENQYPDHKWDTVEGSIHDMLKEMFSAACEAPPPQGMAHSPQSRAMYAVDLMLSWETNQTGEKYIQPKVCEVNFIPDCGRAVHYHPSFFNDVFSALFCDDIAERPIVLL